MEEKMLFDSKDPHDYGFATSSVDDGNGPDLDSILAGADDLPDLETEIDA